VAQLFKFLIISCARGLGGWLHGDAAHRVRTHYVYVPWRKERMCALTLLSGVYSCAGREAGAIFSHFPRSRLPLKVLRPSSVSERASERMCVTKFLVDVT
jgi:hypothetical protein